MSKWYTNKDIPEQGRDILIEVPRGFIVGYYDDIDRNFRYDTELLEYGVDDDSGFYFKDIIQDVIRWAYIDNLGIL